jgi:predicted nuclease of restriction endonuclease-like (RecB) superfamily
MDRILGSASVNQRVHAPTREWYLRAALEYGWSQDVLVLQLKSRLHEREGKALTNGQRQITGLW